MIQKVQDERATLRTRDEMLKQREATLFDWLKEEQASAPTAELPMNGHGGLSDLSEYLTIVLAPGKRFTASTLGDMASERGLIDKDVSPGRAAHAALIGLQNQGRVRKNDDGTWSKV